MFHLIFMDVFEVGDLPLRMVTSLYGWKTSLLGGEFSLGSVAPPWSWAGPPKKVGNYPQKGVSNQIWWSTTSKTSKNMSNLLNLIFTPSQGLLNISLFSLA